MPRTPGPKRFRRYIFNTLTVLSLLLMLATVALWVDSYIQASSVSWESNSRVTNVHSVASNAALYIWIHTNQGQRAYDIEPPGWKWQRELPFWNGQETEQNYYVPGFEYSSNSGTMHVGVPIWFLFLIFATLPAIWIIKWNKRRKFGPNACPACGYDLTGNETGHFRGCPECGVGKTV